MLSLGGTFFIVVIFGYIRSLVQSVREGQQAKQRLEYTSLCAFSKRRLPLGADFEVDAFAGTALVLLGGNSLALPLDFAGTSGSAGGPCFDLAFGIGFGFGFGGGSGDDGGGCGAFLCFDFGGGASGDDGGGGTSFFD